MTAEAHEDGYGVEVTVPLVDMDPALVGMLIGVDPLPGEGTVDLVDRAYRTFAALEYAAHHLAAGAR